VDEIVDTSQITSTTVSISLEDVANVRARSRLEIREGELLDETVDVETDLQDSHVTINMVNVACVEAETVSISDGELVDEIVDTSQITSTTVSISLEDVANVRARSRLEIREGELLDETVDVETDLQDSHVTINMVNVANGHISSPLDPSDRSDSVLYQSDLIDEVVDIGENLVTSTIQVTLGNVGNMLITKGTLYLVDDSHLVDELLDVGQGITASKVSITATRVGNNECETAGTNGLTLANSVLMDAPVDVGTTVDGASMVAVQLTTCANAYVQEIILGKIVESDGSRSKPWCSWSARCSWTQEVQRDCANWLCYYSNHTWGTAVKTSNNMCESVAPGAGVGYYHVQDRKELFRRSPFDLRPVPRSAVITAWCRGRNVGTEYELLKPVDASGPVQQNITDSGQRKDHCPQ